MNTEYQTTSKIEPSELIKESVAQAVSPCVKFAQGVGWHTVSVSCEESIPDHSAVEVLPIEDTRVMDLMQSIKQIGQFDPILIVKSKDGARSIIDGRHRYRACKNLLLDCQALLIDDDDRDWSSWAIERQIASESGRKMSPDQLAAFAILLLANSERTKADERMLSGKAQAAGESARWYEAAARSANTTPHKVRKASKLSQDSCKLVMLGALTLVQAAQGETLDSDNKAKFFNAVTEGRLKDVLALIARKTSSRKVELASGAPACAKSSKPLSAVTGEHTPGSHLPLITSAHEHSKQESTDSNQSFSSFRESTQTELVQDNEEEVSRGVTEIKFTENAHTNGRLIAPPVDENAKVKILSPVSRESSLHSTTNREPCSRAKRAANTVLIDPWGILSPRNELTRLSIDQQKRIPIERFIALNAHLFVASPPSRYADAADLLRAWKFSPVTSLAVVGPRIQDMPSPWESRHYLVLVGSRGVAQFNQFTMRSWFEGEGAAHDLWQLQNHISRCAGPPYLQLFPLPKSHGYDGETMDVRPRQWQAGDDLKA